MIYEYIFDDVYNKEKCILELPLELENDWYSFEIYAKDILVMKVEDKISFESGTLEISLNGKTKHFELSLIEHLFTYDEFDNVPIKDGKKQHTIKLKCIRR